MNNHFIGNNNDPIYGSEGDDTINGTEGDDELHGGAGDDELHGGTGDDELYGDYGNDTLWGGNGDDKLNGGEKERFHWKRTDGDDIIYGGSGNDRIDGGSGNNFLYGGAGDDYLEVHGPTGFTNEVSRTYVRDGVTITDFSSSFLYPSNNYLRGGDGNDILVGGQGNDELWGDDGNDILYGEDRGDSWNHSPGAWNNGEYADRLYGGKGDDRLAGGIGDDILEGHEGTNIFLGGPGADQLIGRAGYNEYNTAAYYYHTFDDDVHSPTGVRVRLHQKTLFGEETPGFGGHAQGDLLLNIGNLIGSIHDDILAGDGGNNIIFGKDGDDRIYGGPEGGDDTLYGGNGNDKLYGGKGNDFLRGDKGFDLLRGGPGDDVLVAINSPEDTTLYDRDSALPSRDTLHGGEGKDIFMVYLSSLLGPRSIILDFEDGKDKIDLSGTVRYADTISGIYFERTPAIEKFGMSSDPTARSMNDLTIWVDETTNNVMIDYQPDASSTVALFELENFNINDLDSSDFIFAA